MAMDGIEWAAGTGSIVAGGEGCAVRWPAMEWAAGTGSIDGWGDGRLLSLPACLPA